VIKPLHRNNTNTLTRCDPMMAQPFGDWSVFKQIFAEHWDEFTHAHPRYQTAYYDGLVAKMLGCGNPDKMGYMEYRCFQCGQGKHLVSMSCKSSLCLRCAKVYVDNWVSQVSQVLHEGVIYRHIILTVPAMFRTTFYHNAAVLLSALLRCGVQCLDDFYSEVRGKTLRGGYIAVLHTHGAMGTIIPICISLLRVVVLIARGSVGSICITCPMRCCVANGSGTCCAWCARRSRAKRSTGWWMDVLSSIPMAW
jgi:hypothetical protein